jgi:hypothetical protein
MNSVQDIKLMNTSATCKNNALNKAEMYLLLHVNVCMSPGLQNRETGKIIMVKKTQRKVREFI